MYYNAKIILSCIHPSNSQTHKPQVKLIQITYLLMFPDRASCPHWPSRRLMAGINICVEDDISPAFHGLECTSATTLLFICHMWVYPIVTHLENRCSEFREYVQNVYFFDKWPFCWNVVVLLDILIWAFTVFALPLNLMMIWLILRCWGNSSIPEGRFSKWF